MTGFVELSPQTSAGLRWHLTPSWLQAVGRDILAGGRLPLERWLADGVASVVKSGPHRTVYRVRLPVDAPLTGTDFHLKHYRPIPLALNPLRLLRASPARREGMRLRQLRTLGIPTLCVEGIGEGDKGESFLITRTLPDALPLSDFLEAELPSRPAAEQTRVRQQLARDLGAFLAQMHRAGVMHHDLHPGNLLVRPAQWRQPAGESRHGLVLIDLHTACVSAGPLSWPASRANLVILNRWFMLRSDRTDRLRFWRAYATARATGEEGPHPATVRARGRDLEQRTLRSNLRFWRQHDARCRGENRYFRKVSAPGLVGHAVADLPADALAPLLADADAPFQSTQVKVLKDSPTSSVVEFDLAGRRVIYKRFAVSSWKAPWAALVRPTPALRSYVLGHGLRLRGLPTPRPLAVWHRKQHGLPHEGYLLTEKVPDAIDLVGFLERLQEVPEAARVAALRGLIDQVAGLIRVLHARHLSHRDLKAANLLVSTASYVVAAKGTRELEGSGEFVSGDGQLVGQVWFIDLVGVRRHLKLTRRRRVQNLTRLHASFHRHPGLTRTDKLRFLRVYLGWGLRGKGGWKRWWRQIEEATRAKVRRNLRNGRPLG